MLVLSRKKGESVIIAGGVEVKVLEIRGNRVKLGFITQPQDKDVPIHRAEVHRQMQQPVEG